MDSLTDSNSIWFSNYMCSNHMTHDRRLFQSIEISNTNKVRMGDGKTTRIEGTGTIEFQTRYR